MTVLLETAFKEVTALPELEQNRVAEWILAELESERQWNHAFAESEDLLSTLADEALLENSKGKTKPLNIDK